MRPPLFIGQLALIRWAELINAIGKYANESWLIGFRHRLARPRWRGLSPASAESGFGGVARPLPLLPFFCQVVRQSWEIFCCLNYFYYYYYKWDSDGNKYPLLRILTLFSVIFNCWLFILPLTWRHCADRTIEHTLFTFSILHKHSTPHSPSIILFCPISSLQIKGMTFGTWPSECLPPHSCDLLSAQMKKLKPDGGFPRWTGDNHLWFLLLWIMVIPGRKKRKQSPLFAFISIHSAPLLML